MSTSNYDQTSKITIKFACQYPLHEEKELVLNVNGFDELTDKEKFFVRDEVKNFAEGLYEDQDTFMDANEENENIDKQIENKCNEIINKLHKFRLGTDNRKASIFAAAASGSEESSILYDIKKTKVDLPILTIGTEVVTENTKVIERPNNNLGKRFKS